MNTNPLAEVDKNTTLIVPTTTPTLTLDEEAKNYICPIMGQIFADPVMLSDGRSYEREAAIRLLAEDDPISPITREKLDINILIPNWSLKQLTLIFVERHPELKNNVYCPNPISQIIEKSLSKPYANIDEMLLTIINNNPEALKKLACADIEQFMRIAYEKGNFATFFAILNHLKIPALQDIALQLMTTPLNSSLFAYPNIFYALAYQKNCPVSYFDSAVNAVGIETSRKLFNERNALWLSIFHAFWMHRHFLLAKNILGFINESNDRTSLIESNVTTTCNGTDEDNEENNNDNEYHTHDYSSLLHYMLQKYPDEDITETVELIKRECSDQIEHLLLKQIKHTNSPEQTTLLRYAFTLGNLENMHILAECCAQNIISDSILTPFNGFQKRNTLLSANGPISLYVESSNSKVIEYSNLVERAYVESSITTVLAMLRLLKTDAAKALLCSWKVKLKVPSDSSAITVPNVIQYLYLTGNTALCTDLEQQQFLNHEQILTAMAEKSTNNWTIFNFAILLNSLTCLQNATTLLGLDKSRQMLLDTTRFTRGRGENWAGSCINQAIRSYNALTKNKNIITLIMTALGDNINESLKILPSPHEHIFTSLWLVNKAELNEFVLNYFDDIDNLLKGYNYACRTNKILLASTVPSSLNNRLLTILNSKKPKDSSLANVIYYAVYFLLPELLEHYLSVCDANLIKNTLFQKIKFQSNDRAQNTQPVPFETNILTFVIYRSNNPPHNTYLRIITILINALQEKALEALKMPYSSDTTFITLLIKNRIYELYPIIIDIFKKIEDLQQTRQAVKSLPESDASKKLIEVIDKRITLLSEQTVANNSDAQLTVTSLTPAVIPDAHSISSPVSSTSIQSLSQHIVTETQLVALSLSKTLNPSISVKPSPDAKEDTFTERDKTMNNKDEEGKQELPIAKMKSL